MLTEQRIRELFRDYLPDDVIIVVNTAEEFVDHAKRHPYIQLQIQMGVYTEDNLATDFLSPARAHSDLSIQVICVDIFNSLLDGIPDDVAEDYVRSVAVHEAHHFHTDHPPVSAAQHASAELACVQEITGKHPELERAVRYVERNSEVYKRVYARIDQLKSNLTMKGRTS